MRLLACVVLTSWFLLSTVQNATHNNPVPVKPAGVEATLIGMENDWGTAVQKKDPAKLENILADEWVGRYPFYTLTKTQELEQIKLGDIKVDSVESSDMQVRIFGDAAVVTGTDEEKGSYKGRDTSGRYLWMDVFVKREGHWRVVASEETLVMQN